MWLAQWSRPATGPSWTRKGSCVWLHSISAGEWQRNARLVQRPQLVCTCWVVLSYAANSLLTWFCQRWVMWYRGESTCGKQNVALVSISGIIIQIKLRSTRFDVSLLCFHRSSSMQVLTFPALEGRHRRLPWNRGYTQQHSIRWPG